MYLIALEVHLLFLFAVMLVRHLVLLAEAGLKRLVRSAAAAVRLVLGHSYFRLQQVVTPLLSCFILVSQP